MFTANFETDNIKNIGNNISSIKNNDSINNINNNINNNFNSSSINGYHFNNNNSIINNNNINNLNNNNTINNINNNINNNNNNLNNNNINNINNNNNFEQYIYLFCGNDHNDINSLYRFNIKNKSIEKMQFKNKNQREFGTFRGSLFSISSTRESIYITNGKSCLKYCLNSEKTKLITNGQWDNTMYRSTFYDKINDYIYLIGGLLNDQLQQSIYRWNIRTGEYIKYAKTNGPILEAQLCYSAQENSIYMLGGWISDKDYNQQIDCFNITDRTVTTIYKFDKKQTLFSHSCYVPKNHSLYIYKWKINQFLRFDIKTKTIHPLASCLKKTNFSRLLFDGDDSIYLPSNSSIFEYRCSTNSWSENQINIDHKYLYTTHRF
ncbi:hypothetical protein ACTFIV_010579 [Dictyostelium citrinum]